ncbi:MAG: hypothetical protein ACLSAF_08690 [Intestinimonas sp.]
MSYAYSDVSHAYSDEDLACWCYDIFGSDGTLLAQGRKSWTGGVLSLCFPGEPGPPSTWQAWRSQRRRWTFKGRSGRSSSPNTVGFRRERRSRSFTGERSSPKPFLRYGDSARSGRRKKGWAVVNDYYQDQEDRQVMEVNYDLGGLLAYFRGTFRFPASFADPEERFYPELVQRARRLAAGPDGWSMGR